MARIDNLTNFLTDVASAIKEKKGDNTPIQASNFDTEIINLPSGGGDIYHVTTIDEMNAIQNPKENDYCLVSLNEMSPINATDSYTSLYFPSKVVLDVPVTDYLDMRLNDENWTVDVSLFGDSVNIDISVYDRSQSSNIRIQYTSADGMTYVLSSSENQSVTLSTAVKVAYEYNETAAKFIYGVNVNFYGIYQYISDIWNYANIGINTKSYDVYPGSCVYTNSGVVEGTMGKFTNNSDFKRFFTIPYKMDSSEVTNLSNAFYNYDKDLIPGLELLDTSNVTDMTNMFMDSTHLTKVPQLDTSNVTEIYGMFRGCSSLEMVPLLNTSKATSMYCMFLDCASLVEVPLLDTSGVTEMRSMFSGCSSLKTIPLLNTTKATNMERMFEGCSSLIEIPQLDTSSVISAGSMFSGCSSLKTIPLLDMGAIHSIMYTFSGCTKLENLGGFKNLGKEYLTNLSANNPNCTLDLSANTNLTHESLMNVINNLYDIKTKGCQVQQLKIGSTNKAKLTEEEIAIATNKGWSVV